MNKGWPGVVPLLLFLGAGGAAAQVTEEKPAPRGWSFTVGAEESWESDPIFESSVDPSSFVTRLGGGLAYQGASRHGSLAFGGTGGGIFYHEVPGYNSYYYGGTLTGRYRLSSKTTFSLIENLTNDYARRSTLLTDGGLLFPLVRTLTSRTDSALVHDFNPRTRLETTFAYDYVKFLSGDLLDGRQIDAGMTLSRRLKNRASLGVAYYFTHSTKEDQIAEDYHTMRLVWSTGAGRNTTLSASGGVTALRRVDRSWSFTPTGNAGVSVAAPRSKLVMALRYAHDVNQAFGLGVERVADLVNFSISRPLGRKTSASAGYGYSLSRETAAAASQFSFVTHNANCGIRYAASRTLGVDLGYTFFNTGYYTPAVNNHVLSLNLAYRREPR